MRGDDGRIEAGYGFAEVTEPAGECKPGLTLSKMETVGGKKMKKHPEIAIEHELDVVEIFPGQTLTLWLHKVGTNKPRKAIQAEVRITKRGAIEIFVARERVKIQEFKVWKPLEENNG